MQKYIGQLFTLAGFCGLHFIASFNMLYCNITTSHWSLYDQSENCVCTKSETYVSLTVLDSTKAAAFNPVCELAGNLVLFASLVSGLHYALECFADDCEVAMARFTISESFSARSVCRPPQNRGVNNVRVLFTFDGKIQRDIDIRVAEMKWVASWVAWLVFTLGVKCSFMTERASFIGLLGMPT